MKDGIEIRFLETFHKLFKTTFEECDYEIDFGKENASSQLKIEGQIAKLKKTRPD